MTDAVQVGTEWVPPLGMLEELPSEHAAVIRGLFELAAFVADHPEFRAPIVAADFYLPWQDRPSDAGAEYAAARELVDRLAVALGVEPTEADGHYAAKRATGGVTTGSVAISPARMALHKATYSYAGAVQPDEPARENVTAVAVGGAR